MAGAKKKAKVAKSLEATLWEAADKLRGNLEAAEYKHPRHRHLGRLTKQRHGAGRDLPYRSLRLAKRTWLTACAAAPPSFPARRQRSRPPTGARASAS